MTRIRITRKYYEDWGRIQNWLDEVIGYDSWELVYLEAETNTIHNDIDSISGGFFRELQLKNEHDVTMFLMKWS